MRAISSRLNMTASMPLRRMALPRRLKESSCGSLWARLMTPRWLNMTLKLRSWESPSQSFKAWS
jgi:hypothetical protein